MDVILGLIKNLKNKYNLHVQFLHTDNAGENVVFEQACKQEWLGVELECTALGMPQQNGCIEQKVATLFNRACTMLNGGKFNTFLQNSLWAEAVSTAMLLKNNLLTKNRTLSSF